MRRLWNWFEGLVHFRLIFNRIQIKDLAFSEKCLVDHKWPFHYQLQDKRVLKTSLFSEGPAVSCEWMLNSDCLISDRQLWTLGCSLRSGEIRAKIRRLWNWFEGLVHFWLIFKRLQIKDLAFSDKCLIDHKWPLHYQLQDKQDLKTSLLARDLLWAVSEC